MSSSDCDYCGHEKSAGRCTNDSCRGPVAGERKHGTAIPESGPPSDFDLQNLSRSHTPLVRNVAAKYYAERIELREKIMDLEGTIFRKSKLINGLGDELSKGNSIIKELLVDGGFECRALGCSCSSSRAYKMVEGKEEHGK